MSKNETSFFKINLFQIIPFMRTGKCVSLNFSQIKAVLFPNIYSLKNFCHLIKKTHEPFGGGCLLNITLVNCSFSSASDLQQQQIFAPICCWSWQMEHFLFVDDDVDEPCILRIVSFRLIVRLKMVSSDE